MPSTDWYTPDPYIYTLDFGDDLTASDVHSVETFDFSDADLSTETAIVAPTDGVGSSYVAVAKIWRYDTVDSSSGIHTRHFAEWTINSTGFLRVGFARAIDTAVQAFLDGFDYSRPAGVPDTATLHWEHGVVEGLPGAPDLGYPIGGSLVDGQVDSTLVEEAWGATLTYGADSNPIAHPGSVSTTVPVANFELRRYGDFHAEYPAGPSDIFTPRSYRELGVRWADALSGGTVEPTGLIHPDLSTLPTLGDIAGTPAPYMTLGLIYTGGFPAAPADDTVDVVTAHIHLNSQTLTWQPPRYRWVWPGRPPLAWRQRIDGAATTGATLAQIDAPGGARPTLAWRQNSS